MRYLWGILLVFLVALPALSEAPEERTIEVRVAQGDTFRTICMTYLRDQSTWPEVARLNGITDPNLIRPGQVIRIPARLAKAAPSEGKAEFLRGKAEIRTPGSTEWGPLAVGDRIPEGAAVRTSAASSLEIAFENGDTCFLRPETTVGMTETSRQGDTWIRRIFLQAGKIIAKVRKATGTLTRFEIKTPSAQCAARGTLFRATADKDDTSRAEVLEGAVAVEAMGSRVEVGESFGTAVKTGEAPLPPRPLLPGPVPARIESVYRKIPVRIDLLPVPKAVSYFVELTRDRPGRDAVVEAVLAAGRTFEAGSLDDGVYYLQARAIDDVGLEGLPAVPVEIRVRTEPRPLALEGIVQGAQIHNGTPSIRWAPVPGAESYELQLARDSGFASLVGGVVTGTSAWSPAGLTVGSYFLRGRAIAPDGFEGDWSETTGFSVLPPYPPPSLERPRRESGYIRLRWSRLGPSVVYRVIISRDKDFRTTFYNELAPGTEVLVPGPEESGAYYVRIKGFDADGSESGYSNVQKFRVGGFWEAICTPCLLGPLAVLVWLLAR